MSTYLRLWTCEACEHVWADQGVPDPEGLAPCPACGRRRCELEKAAPIRQEYDARELAGLIEQGHRLGVL